MLGKGNMFKKHRDVVAHIEVTARCHPPAGAGHIDQCCQMTWGKAAKKRVQGPVSL